jgi:hypothetical protein
MTTPSEPLSDPRIKKPWRAPVLIDYGTVERWWLSGLQHEWRPQPLEQVERGSYVASAWRADNAVA